MHAPSGSCPCPYTQSGDNHSAEDHGAFLDTAPGTAVLVVGPSGAGKDTLIGAARDRLGACSGFLFPNRFITRGPDPGGEPHEPVTPAEFEALEQAGAFCMTWSAHGLSYGIPSTVLSALARGRHAVLNLSRRRIPLAREVFGRTAVISVTAPVSVLAERLALRGRETREEIEERLSTAVLPPLQGMDVQVLNNDGSVDDGISAFLAILAGIAPACRALQPV